jgi:hypothetical protein
MYRNFIMSRTSKKVLRTFMRFILSVVAVTVRELSSAIFIDGVDTYLRSDVMCFYFASFGCNNVAFKHMHISDFKTARKR